MLSNSRSTVWQAGSGIWHRRYLETPVLAGFRAWGVMSFLHDLHEPLCSFKLLLAGSSETPLLCSRGGGSGIGSGLACQHVWKQARVRL